MSSFKGRERPEEFKADLEVEVVPPNPRHDRLYMSGLVRDGESLLEYATQVTNDMCFPLPPFHIAIF